MSELVRNALIDFTNEEKKVIRKQFFPPVATESDMKYCMSVAMSLGLNPILKEIYFVERKAYINGQWHTKIEPLVGRDGRLAIAHRSGVFDGMESWVEYKDIPKLTSQGWKMIKELVGCCKVYRKDMGRSFYVEVPFYEYAQKTKDGRLTSIWADKPTTMIKKVAESQALAKAFNINGVIDEFTPDEEIIENTNIGNPTKKEDIKTLLSENNNSDVEKEDVDKNIEEDKLEENKTEELKDEPNIEEATKSEDLKDSEDVVSV